MQIFIYALCHCYMQMITVLNIINTYTRTQQTLVNYMTIEMNRCSIEKEFFYD